MEERLQKVLAAQGVASRRKCEEMISQGRVKVNGEIITQLGYKVKPASDMIEVDGKKMTKENQLVYVLFYKPTGVITSTSDPQGRKVVTDFISSIKERVYPVGRLDFDTAGLLLLTNDGELAYKITHPKFELDKVYLATVRGIPTDQALQNLRDGVLLEDGKTSPAKAELTAVNETKNQATIKLTIHEGRNRQVRRMCDQLGHPVVQLKRVQLGALTLGDLKPGQYRFLSLNELDTLRSLL